MNLRILEKEAATVDEEDIDHVLIGMSPSSEDYHPTVVIQGTRFLTPFSFLFSLFLSLFSLLTSTIFREKNKQTEWLIFLLLLLLLLLLLFISLSLNWICFSSHENFAWSIIKYPPHSCYSSSNVHFQDFGSKVCPIPSPGLFPFSFPPSFFNFLVILKQFFFSFLLFFSLLNIQDHATLFKCDEKLPTGNDGIPF